MLKLTQKEIKAVISKLKMEHKNAEKQAYESVKARPEIVAAVDQDLEWYSKVSGLVKDELGELNRNSLLERYVDDYINKHPMRLLKSDRHIEDEIVLTSRKVDNVDQLLEMIDIYRNE